MRLRNENREGLQTSRKRKPAKICKKHSRTKALFGCHRWNDRGPMSKTSKSRGKTSKNTIFLVKYLETLRIDGWKRYRMYVAKIFSFIFPKKKLFLHCVKLSYTSLHISGHACPKFSNSGRPRWRRRRQSPRVQAPSETCAIVKDTVEKQMQNHAQKSTKPV